MQGVYRHCSSASAPLNITARIRALDWGHSWHAAVRAAGESIAQAQDLRAALNAATAEQQLQNHRGLPLSFVPQQALPPGTAYEAYISATGQVPTRDNLHDFFNALVWLSFPLIKRQLNALQAGEIERAGAKLRGRLRDAATLFDENAALVVLRDGTPGRELAQALRERRWHDAFIGQRAAFETDCHIFLFGHALMEKLATPYKAITAHAWLLTASADFFELPLAAQTAWIDNTIARQLSHDLTPSSLTPLPVMGVPGWSERQDAAFYMDAEVFRPPRMGSC